ncbi:MAG: HyaD/HybD family hydrogenase maturation endopeptidase [Sporomusaceae bacterium]|nr:HyaD/HybD family hydrogenase maturation endopeptidase [Sporomusaceae bacterium]
MKKTIILGIGNILLSDEGFGVKAVTALDEKYKLSEGAEFLDGGTLGMDLIPYLSEAQRLVILDCIQGGGEPGDVYDFRGEAVNLYFQNAVSLHDIGIQQVLAILQVLETPLEEVVVLGVQPLSLDVGMELTDPVSVQLEPICKKTLQLLAEWQVEVTMR